MDKGDFMVIGVIGLGLIGGTIAKSIRLNTDHTVLGRDIDRSVVLKAKLMEAINYQLENEEIPKCDMIIIALYPQSTLDVLNEIAPYISQKAVVIDCAGIKENICIKAREISQKYGFTFIGGHPMAGIEKSGFEYSNAEIFKNASMILTPYSDTSIEMMHNIKKFFLSIGFGKITVKTPSEHDRIIAYTSQLAHVLSSAYIKSPTARDHRGLSAGSFKDMTRVAYLNETMWSELFFDNKDNLLNEIDTLIGHLQEYKNALESDDKILMTALLKDGKDKKILADSDEVDL